MSEPDSRILEGIRRYYTEKIEAHGPSPEGVDWNSSESQCTRFSQLCGLLRDTGRVKILDYGCGYGALIDFLDQSGIEFEYCGFDLSDSMLASARSLYGDRSNCVFVSQPEDLPVCDYALASGIFNTRGDTPTSDWEAYVLQTINHLDTLSRRGFGFNALTIHSDVEYMRPDLYYADPLFLFSHCRVNYSRWVSLLHDYGLYEFSVLVRKLGES